MTKIIWDNADFVWDDNPYTWDEVLLVTEALGGGGVMAEDMPWTQWGDKDDRKKKLIKLICKVQGKTITEEKEFKEFKIKISDIKLLAEKVLGIEILTENIKF
tara:strand:- start:576 stop:884 length:309 start_codon:yes stop_codon:yes gene_type:complete